MKHIKRERIKDTENSGQLNIKGPPHWMGGIQGAIFFKKKRRILFGDELRKSRERERKELYRV